jgi:hypothetical protein
MQMDNLSLMTISVSMDRSKLTAAGRFWRPLYVTQLKMPLI